MKPGHKDLLPGGSPSPESEAAVWTLRHDRGLTAAEQDEFSAWLAADPRCRAAWAEHRWGWDELDRLAGLQTSVHAVPDPDLLANKPILSWSNGLRLGSQGFLREHWRQTVMLAAMIALVATVLWPRRVPTVQLPPVQVRAPRTLALIEERSLADGSVIALNRSAEVTEHYTPGERRVRLERGEAHFTVSKDAARPIIVEAGGVAVRAVGTAFTVRLDAASVEVLVTEGKVSVLSAAVGGVPSPREIELPLVSAGERTVVSLAPTAPPPQITAVPPAEIEARLAWQPRLLDFTGAPLAEIVAEFNRRNPVRLTLGDPGLGDLRLSATFRSDNVEGFVRLMESDFGMKAEWRGADEIVLFLAQPKTR